MDEDDPQIADRIEAHTLEYGSVAEQKREIAVDLFVGNNIIPSAWCPYQNMSTDQLTRLIAEKTGHKARKCSITMTPENCQAEAVRQVNREFDCHEQVFVDIEPVTQPRNRQSEQELIDIEFMRDWDGGDMEDFQGLFREGFLSMGEGAFADFGAYSTAGNLR
ncbi:MAG: hypothetical protein MMC33_001819 [Icmadophila ericetorum]|nr:hypothetical protein [Icmadophila ericetorum]